MLGELYKPKGLALETAQQVFESEDVHALNIAWGCTNRCTDCFIRYIKPGEIRFPKNDPCSLVRKQLDDGLETDGVFISFNTDPLLQCNLLNTVKVTCLLRERNIPVAILSKMGVVPVAGSTYEHIGSNNGSKLDIHTNWNFIKKIRGIKHGMTIKSLDESFRKTHEPNAISISERIKILRVAHAEGEYTWVSDEPHPCPAIHKQNDQEFWESINFVDFIIYGKWNYNASASTPESRDYYSENVPKFIDFCNDYGIRYHVKSETMNFINKEVKK